MRGKTHGVCGRQAHHAARDLSRRCGEVKCLSTLRNSRPLNMRGSEIDANGVPELLVVKLFTPVT